MKQFKVGEHKMYVHGYYDNLDNQIYLGSRVKSPIEW